MGEAESELRDVPRRIARERVPTTPRALTTSHHARQPPATLQARLEPSLTRLSLGMICGAS